MLADSTADVPDTRIPRHLTQAGDAPTDLASSNRLVWLLAVGCRWVGCGGPTSGRTKHRTVARLSNHEPVIKPKACPDRAGWTKAARSLDTTSEEAVSHLHDQLSATN